MAAERGGGPAGGNSGSQNFGGVQVTGGVIHGHVAGGAHARVHIDTAPPGPAAASAERALVEAAAALRAELARLRAERPGAVEEADAADAERALAEIEAAAGGGQPQPGVLRRRIVTVVDALTGVTAVATALGALRAAFEALFPGS
ncbi:DUF5955 family protein [Streptomyces sp. NPDC092296]|uniref:DUF5955 family protein n=1 Tax=Streptomyces sp. NPDC092296 TaxID=3366012 RepID=UPI0037FFF973